MTQIDEPRLHARFVTADQLRGLDAVEQWQLFFKDRSEL